MLSGLATIDGHMNRVKVVLAHLRFVLQLFGVSEKRCMLPLIQSHVLVSAFLNPGFLLLCTLLSGNSYPHLWKKASDKIRERMISSFKMG